MRYVMAQKSDEVRKCTKQRSKKPTMLHEAIRKKE